MEKLVGYGIVILITLVPFLNHLVYCFKSKYFSLLIAGAIVPPVG